MVTHGLGVLMFLVYGMRTQAHYVRFFTYSPHANQTRQWKENNAFHKFLAVFFFPQIFNQKNKSFQNFPSFFHHHNAKIRPKIK